MAQVIACHSWDETKDTAVPSLLALYLSWNIHLGGSQPLCHEYTMERLHAKELRPSANSHVSESGSSFSSQIKTSDDYTLAEISTAVSWETHSQDNPAKLLPDFCQIGLYIYKLNIWDYKYVYTHISEQHFGSEKKKILDVLSPPWLSQKQGETRNFCCFKLLRFGVICSAAVDD